MKTVALLGVVAFLGAGALIGCEEKKPAAPVTPPAKTTTPPASTTPPPASTTPPANPAPAPSAG